ncbi:MAG: peptide ABC transporter substrate-binding protein [Romboutsia sp.]
MKLKKITAVLMASMLVSVSVMGCSSSSSTEQSTENAGGLDAEQYYNGYLSAEPTTLDSAKASDSYADDVIQNVLEPLARLEEDDQKKNVIKPAGAESWEVSEDGTVWTFKIRDNKWSDGVAVTAKDYEYGITRTIDPKTGSPMAYLLSPIKNANEVNSEKLPVEELGVKALDDKTLEITLSEPTPYFLSLTYQRVMFPQREDVVTAQGEKYGSEAETTIYNGPFVVSKWVHNNEVVMTKNDNYWDKDTVKLNTVNYKIISDENAILNSFENGSIDSVGVSKVEWIEKFKSKENADYISYTNPQVNFKFFNTKNELFQNTNIRKAFALGVNREEIANVIFNGRNEAAYGWVPKNVSSGDVEYREVVEEPYQTLKKENPDPKVLLLKGMEELGLGTDPSKLDVTMTFGGTDQWFRTYGEYIQQSYKKSLGIEIKIEFLEWPVFMSNVSKGDFQIGYMGWMSEFNDPMAMLSLLKSDSTAILSGWKNDEYDKLIDQARVEMDDAKRIELYKQAEKIALYDDAVVCPTVYVKSNLFRYKYIKNMAETPFSTQGLKYVYTSGR